MSKEQQPHQRNTSQDGRNLLPDFGWALVSWQPTGHLILKVSDEFFIYLRMAISSLMILDDRFAAQELRFIKRERDEFHEARTASWQFHNVQRSLKYLKVECAQKIAK